METTAHSFNLTEFESEAPSFAEIQCYSQNASSANTNGSALVQGNISRAKAMKVLHEDSSVQSSRIVGGQNAARGQFPYQVRLLDSTSGSECGGTIYNERYVLTAAHCVRPPPLSVQAIVGDHSRSKVDPMEVSHNVTRIVVHHDYNSLTYENDLALLKVNPPIKYTPSAHAPQFPGVNFNYSAGHAEVSGWGAEVENGPNVDILKFVRVAIVNQVTCSQAHGFPIEDTELCAGTKGASPCNGDSGGPLSFITTGPSKCPKDNTYVIGVVSSGKRCGETSIPGIFMKIEKYLDWIKLNAV